MRTTMGNLSSVLLASLACLFSSGTAQAQAQFGADNAISATGSSVLKKEPTILRLQIELMAKADNIDDAMPKLMARREAAKKQVEALEADPGSIKFEGLRVMSGQTNERQQMEMMIRHRMRSSVRPAGRDEARSEPVSLSVTLTADWPLDAANPEQRLVLVHKLQEKVKDADLAGQKELEELSPEEQELAEEDEDFGMMSSYGYGEQTKPGEPVFVYVAKLTEEERNNALADAFEKARAEAGRLAAAAGVTLGPLRQLTGSSILGGSSMYVDDWTEYGMVSNNPILYRILQRAQRGDSTNNEEAVGLSPASVSSRVSLTASFAIK